MGKNTPPTHTHFHIDVDPHCSEHSTFTHRVRFRKQEPFGAIYWKWNSCAKKTELVSASVEFAHTPFPVLVSLSSPLVFISPLFSTSSSHDCFLDQPDTISSSLIRLLLNTDYTFITITQIHTVGKNVDVKKNLIHNMVDYKWTGREWVAWFGP